MNLHNTLNRVVFCCFVWVSVITTGCRMTGPGLAADEEMEVTEFSDGYVLYFQPAPQSAVERIVERSACPFWFGTDGQQPERVLERGWITFPEGSVSLDVSCMATCLFCSFTGSPTLTGNRWGDKFTLDITTSDGAGTYYASWVFTSVGAVRTRLETWSEREGRIDSERRD